MKNKASEISRPGAFPEFPGKIKRIFFSGILGVSMSALALYCKEKGLDVSGSDTGDDPETRAALTGAGITVFPRHDARNVEGYDCLVYTAALDEDCSEIAFALGNGIPCISRAGLLCKIAAGFETRIGVSGTHGKSTTCGLCGSVFREAGEAVQTFIGAGDLCAGKAGGIARPGGTVLFEACEYKRSFLALRADIAVVTNIEKEHTDCYKDLDEARSAYSAFAGRAKLCLLSLDCGSSATLDTGPAEKAFFSLSDPRAEVYGRITGKDRGAYSFELSFEGGRPYEVRLTVPGRHNVENALAAAGAAYYAGIPAERIPAGLEAFAGMKRRLTFVGTCGGSPVYDDYAHHPTEVRSTLTTLREMGFGRIVCAFQPHTYSRTREFFREFAETFSEYSDVTVFADIYAAREKEDTGVSSKMLAAAVSGGVYVGDIDIGDTYPGGMNSGDAHIAGVDHTAGVDLRIENAENSSDVYGTERIARFMRAFAGPGTVLLTMGAGKLDRVARLLVNT